MRDLDLAADGRGAESEIPRCFVLGTIKAVDATFMRHSGAQTVFKQNVSNHRCETIYE
jgi:hypothetical protein